MTEKNITPGLVACMFLMFGLAWSATIWAEANEVMDHLFGKGFSDMPWGLVLKLSPSVIAYALAVYFGVMARRSASKSVDP